MPQSRFGNPRFRLRMSPSENLREFQTSVDEADDREAHLTAETFLTPLSPPRPPVRFGSARR